MSNAEPPVTLTHISLGELELGGIGYAIDSLLAEAMDDCVHRPGVIKARTVVIKVAITPQPSSLDQGGRPGLSNVDVKVAMNVSKPAQASSGEVLMVRPGVNANGEPITEAVFPMTPLLRPGSN
ncbi:hypothetical protein K7W42_20460 [Deinococcus sp. HMF7604]|uniref:hypothetical protein n=1 Tax=Deinococcus betulae TaxID=2873312 RepID=UPI001CCFAF54|nr:hypothetical protein [Deinococcus betulae]MBZ9753213.1 hypothetical protein [Deinococcus betulae]